MLKFMETLFVKLLSRTPARNAMIEVLDAWIGAILEQEQAFMQQKRGV